MACSAAGVSLVVLEPTHGRVSIHHGSAVLVTGQDGILAHEDREQGLFVYETRFLHRWRWRLRGAAPLEPVLASPVEDDRWMGYFLAPSAPGRDPAVDSVELVVRRTMAADGFQEEATLESYARAPATRTLELELEVDGDFRDQTGVSRDVRWLAGEGRRRWRSLGEGCWELALEWRASRAYLHRWDVGRARLHRVLRVRFQGEGCELRPRADVLRVCARLAPHERARVIATIVARVEEHVDYPVHRAAPVSAAPFAAGRTRLEVPGADGAGGVVARAFERAAEDLVALRLPEFDLDAGAWVPAAGAPTFLALFARDAMIGGIHAAMLAPEPLAGALAALAATAGTRDDPWRDEWPGRIVHEVHAAPLSVAEIEPHARYYGSLTASAMYSVALGELWAWTGDRARVAALIDTALAGLRWMDAHGDLDGDGLYEYRRRSPRGLKNQGWKDSGDAIVHADGREAEPPIATCEAQAYTFLAKRRLADVLEAFGRDDEARLLRRQAEELRRRFVDAFWLEDLGTFAMGLDRRKRPIRSVASDAGHCLATGIVPRELRRRVADRLLEPDMHSGWGVRTLSSAHPAFDPYSYHRGSVWPVEQGTIGLGMARTGLHEHAARVARGTFDAAALFAHARLPEVMSGHARDAEHPFPAVYPRTCWPQAWSAGAVVALVRALAGIEADAPHRRVHVDPHLPSWLPELTLLGVRVGDATVDLRLWRSRSGTSDVEVLGVRGALDVVRRSFVEQDASLFIVP